MVSIMVPRHMILGPRPIPPTRARAAPATWVVDPHDLDRTLGGVRCLRGGCADRFLDCESMVTIVGMPSFSGPVCLTALLLVREKPAWTQRRRPEVEEDWRR